MKHLNHSRNLMVGGFAVNKIVVLQVQDHQVVPNVDLKAVKVLHHSVAVEMLENGMKCMKSPTVASAKTNMPTTIGKTQIALTQLSTMTVGAIGAVRPHNSRKPTA